METEYIKQTISNHIEVRKYLATFVVVLSSGVVALLIGDFNFIRFLLFIIGTILDVLLILGITSQNERIEFLIKELRGVNK